MHLSYTDFYQSGFEKGSVISETRFIDCMLLSCHVRVLEWIYTLLMVECSFTN